MAQLKAIKLYLGMNQFEEDDLLPESLEEVSVEPGARVLERTLKRRRKAMSSCHRLEKKGQRQKQSC